MSRKNQQVLVCGAGPVGLMTALLLARRGIPVTVIEAESDIVSSPRAIGYQFVTAELLQRAGVLQEALAMGFTRQETQMRTTQAVLAQTNLQVIAGDTPYPFTLHLPQDALARILLQHLQALSVSVRWSTRFVGLHQDQTGVTVDAEGEQGPWQHRAQWLIAADGGRSAVRKACGLDFPGTTWPEFFVATNVYCDFESRGYARANYVHDPAHWSVMTKISNDGLWRVVYGESADATAEEIRQRLPSHFEHIVPPGLPYEVTLCTPYRVHQRSAERYRADRVLLAGDAAHVTNPMGGLGLTSGLLDAEALCDALVSVIHGERGEAVLNEYAEDRRSVYLNVTSPMATESKRRITEQDPERRRQDAQRLRRLNDDKELQRQALLGIGALRGKSFAVG